MRSRPSHPPLPCHFSQTKQQGLLVPSASPETLCSPRAPAAPLGLTLNVMDPATPPCSSSGGWPPETTGPQAPTCQTWTPRPMASGWLTVGSWPADGVRSVASLCGLTHLAPQYQHYQWHFISSRRSALRYLSLRSSAYGWTGGCAALTSLRMLQPLRSAGQRQHPQRGCRNTWPGSLPWFICR
jgi:hypothetical protein